jgi:hypothetical protein
MRRHQFLTQTHETRKTIIESKINVGERWINKVNGSVITILAKKSPQCWDVHETAKGNFKTHDNGTKEILESFILNFYKKET